MLWGDLRTPFGTGWRESKRELEKDFSQGCVVRSQGTMA